MSASDDKKTRTGKAKKASAKSRATKKKGGTRAGSSGGGSRKTKAASSPEPPSKGERPSRKTPRARGADADSRARPKPPRKKEQEHPIGIEGDFDRGAWADEPIDPDASMALDMDPLEEFFAGPEELGVTGPAGLPAALHGTDWDEEREASAVDGDYLSFILANEEYAVPITSLREIVRPIPITEVPRTPPYVLGVLTLRGAVLPVLDLRIRLGLPVGEEQRAARILVIETDDGPAGILADRVAEVVRIGNEPLEPPPGALGAGAELLNGIIRRDGRMLIVLNLEAALRVEGAGESSSRRKAGP